MRGGDESERNGKERKREETCGEERNGEVK